MWQLLAEYYWICTGDNKQIINYICRVQASYNKNKTSKIDG